MSKNLYSNQNNQLDNSIENHFDYHQAKILVVGDIILDDYWQTDVNRISPESPVPIANYNQSETRLAGAALIADIINGMGAEVDLVSIVNNNEPQALKLLDILKQRRISNSRIDIRDQQSENQYISNRIRVVTKSNQLLRVDQEIQYQDKSVYSDNKISKNILSILKDYNTIVFFVNNRLTSNQKNNLDQYLQYCKEHQINTIYSTYNNIDSPEILSDYTVLKDHIVNNQHNKIIMGADSRSGINNTQDDSQVENTIGLEETKAAVLALLLSIKDYNNKNNTNNNTLSNYQINIISAASSYILQQFGQAVISRAALQLEYADKILGSINNIDNIFNNYEFQQAVKSAKANGRKIVFTNGCFDVLHIGHLDYLQKAKQQGDVLIVAINSDCSIKRLKGPTRPVNNLQDRMLMLSSLEYIDWVIPFYSDTPCPFLQWLQPDILLKGGDYDISGVVGREFVESYGGEVRVIKQIYNTSSTKILDHYEQK